MLWKNEVFYIAVYGPYKPYISSIRNTECSNAPELTVHVICYLVGVWRVSKFICILDYTLYWPFMHADLATQCYVKCHAPSPPSRPPSEGGWPAC